MTTKIRYILLLALAIIMVVACSKDQLDEQELVCEDAIIYADVRVLISESCGYNDCHNGFKSLDNYNNYAGIERHLNSGEFSERVFIKRDMPTPDAAGPTTLTEEQILLLRCWEQNGFSEF